MCIRQLDELLKGVCQWLRIEQFNDILTHADYLQKQTIWKDYVSSLAKLAICLSRDHLDFTPI